MGPSVAEAFCEGNFPTSTSDVCLKTAAYAAKLSQKLLCSEHFQIKLISFEIGRCDRLAGSDVITLPSSLLGLSYPRSVDDSITEDKAVLVSHERKRTRHAAILSVCRHLWAVELSVPRSISLKLTWKSLAS